jgi:hypothetical protein
MSETAVVTIRAAALCAVLTALSLLGEGLYVFLMTGLVKPVKFSGIFALLFASGVAGFLPMHPTPTFLTSGPLFKGRSIKLSLTLRLFLVGFFAGYVAFATILYVCYGTALAGGISYYLAPTLFFAMLAVSFVER